MNKPILKAPHISLSVILAMNMPCNCLTHLEGK